MLTLSIHKKGSSDDVSLVRRVLFHARELHAAYALLVGWMRLPLDFDHGRGLCWAVEELPFWQSNPGHPNGGEVMRAFLWTAAVLIAIGVLCRAFWLTVRSFPPQTTGNYVLSLIGDVALLCWAAYLLAGDGCA